MTPWKPGSPPRKGRYTPINPAALGGISPAPNAPDSIIKSAITGSNADLFHEASKLWITDDDIVADVTYGRGIFWQKMARQPDYAFDALTGHSLRALPLDDKSINVLVLDPPYRPTHGSSFGGNRLADAYQLDNGELTTIEDVLSLYRAGIQEAARVMTSSGRLLVKCQDLSHGRRLHLVSLDVLNIMVESGFQLVDQFILIGQANLKSPTWKRQERARRNHSILWVGVRE